MEETAGVAAALLPDDALADVFRRLPPRSLAAARRVCRAWRGVVDARALLRPYQDLLPHSTHGVFINYVDYQRAHLLARRRPSSATTIPAGIINSALGFIPKNLMDYWQVLDHCRGLLLCAGLGLFVCNPATRQWKRLPSCIGSGRCGWGMYLVFDPATSPHYEVFLIPAAPNKPSPKDQCHHSMMLWHSIMVWPPTPWKLEVFSSSTGQWEKKVFVREGKPAGMMQDIWLDPEEPTLYGPRQRYAVFHKGDLYVHCQGHFIARFTLSNVTYQVIQTPTYIDEKDTWGKPYLDRSENEVYFGIVQNYKIRIWILSESHGQLEWILKYQDELRYSSQDRRRMVVPWMLDDVHEIHVNNDDDIEEHRDNNGNDKNHDEDHEGSDDNSNYSDDDDNDGDDCDGDEDDEGNDDNSNYNDDENNDRDDNDGDEDDEGNDDNSNYNDDDDGDDNDGDEDNEANDGNNGRDIAAETEVKERVEWDSDNEDFITIQDGPKMYYNAKFDIIGFHPYKKIVFLADFLEVVAYHLTSSKIQYLGYSCPKDYYIGHANGMYETFVYTPCMIRMLDEEIASQSSQWISQCSNVQSEE